MQQKRFLSLLLAVWLVFSLAACSSNHSIPTEPEGPSSDTASGDTADFLDDLEPDATPAELSSSTLRLPGVPEAVSAVPDTVLPLTEEDVHFTFWIYTQQQMTQYGYTTAEDWQVIREMKERTGISVDFEMPADASTQFGIMMASGDLPDLIEGFKYYYNYGMDHAIDEELILPLEEYQQYLPHLFAIVESSPEIHNQCYTDNGHMPGIPFFKIDSSGKNEGTWAGYMIRQDWQDELNLDIPTTYDELDSVLAAFQANYPSAAHPLMVQCASGNFIRDFGALFHAGYNITGDWIQENGTVVFSPLTDRYRDFVTMMTDWYAKGYLNSDQISAYYTMYMDPGNSLLDEYGVFPIVYYNDEQIYEANRDRPEYKLSPLPVLHVDENTAIHVGHETDYAVVSSVITTSCEQPDLLLQYWDYLFSDEGILLSNFGLEHVNFEFDENGNPQWIPEAFSSDDPSWTLQRFMAINLLYNMPGYTIFDREFVMCLDSSLFNQKVWNEGWDSTWNYPESATMSAEESEAFGAAMNDISTYVTEMLGKYILGMELLTDESWDAFITHLHEMGIDDCISYKQAALDRYLAR